MAGHFITTHGNLMFAKDGMQNINNSQRTQFLSTLCILPTYDEFLYESFQKGAWVLRPSHIFQIDLLNLNWF